MSPLPTFPRNYSRCTLQNLLDGSPVNKGNLYVTNVFTRAGATIYAQWEKSINSLNFMIIIDVTWYGRLGKDLSSLLDKTTKIYFLGLIFLWFLMRKQKWFFAQSVFPPTLSSPECERKLQNERFLLTAGPSSCDACFEDAANNGNDLEQCIGVQYQFTCSNITFPNVGSTHCYTAAGWYRQNNMLKTGIIRGCINCTGQ